MRMNIYDALRLMAMGLICCMAANGRILHVKCSGDDGNDGQSWNSALKHPQNAIAMANPGDEVWIACGEYKPVSILSISGTEAYSASFVMADGVSLYGGFFGNEKTLSERMVGEYDWVFVNETIFSGSEEMPGSVVICDFSRSSMGCVINGITMTGGRALGRGNDGCGGGLLLAANMLLEKCVIRGNIAMNGGGACLGENCTVANCLFVGNTAVSEGLFGRGGGIFCRAGCFIEDCLFEKNVAVEGGGIYADGKVSISSCTIVRNESSRWGSALKGGNGKCELVNSIIWGNTGCLEQLHLGENHLVKNAVEAGFLPEGNIPLQASNAGARGPAANDNRPGRYYACFRSPENGDFRLATGSYLIGRGASKRAKTYDIGVFQSGFPGNLAVDLVYDAPMIYGCNVGINAVFGILTPGGAKLQFAEEDVCCLNSGRHHYVVICSCNDSYENMTRCVWNNVDLAIDIEVLPRPIVIAADDEDEEESPAELTWRLISGELVQSDKIHGKLELRRDNGKNSISLGTLAVKDGNDGKNYKILFLGSE